MTVQTASDCTFKRAFSIEGEMYCSATAVILTYPQIYHVCPKHEAETRPALPFVSLLRKEEMHTHSLFFFGSLCATHKNMQVWISCRPEANGTLLGPSHELPLLNRLPLPIAFTGCLHKCNDTVYPCSQCIIIA